MAAYVFYRLSDACRTAHEFLITTLVLQQRSVFPCAVQRRGQRGRLKRGHKVLPCSRTTG